MAGERGRNIMRKVRATYILFAVLALVCACGVFSGCGRRIGGPRFWYDDRNRTRLDDYYLPDDPSAPAEYGVERRADPSGGDLSEDDLDNYHTDVDREEEDRKADASLLNF